MIVLVLYSLLFLIGIFGLILLGIKNENDRKERMLQESLRALRIVGISKGRHLR